MDDSIRAMSRSLLDVQDSICAAEYEKRRVVLAHGLSSLPDDILRLIFAEVTDALGRRSWTTPFRLSSVCRRFRSVVVSSPSMWSFVSTDALKREAIDLCLRRSCNVGLSLEIQGGRNVADDFYILVKRHCERWESLDIHLREDSDLDGVFSDMQPIALPRLKDMTISHALPNKTLLGKIVQYSSTFAPNLHVLNLDISIGMSINTHHVLPASLRRLELKIFGSNLTGASQNLVLLLQSAPLLEDVKLDVRTPESFAGGTEFFTFPNIIRLSLRLDALRGLKTLLRILYFPNLQELSVVLSEKYREKQEKQRSIFSRLEGLVDVYERRSDVKVGMDLMDELLGNKKVYKYLTTLSLNLHFPGDASHDHGAENMKKLFVTYGNNFPALQHLTLQTTILIKYLDLPPLRTLTLV